MSIGAALKSRYGLDGWTLIDRGQGSGPELTQWDRNEPKPTQEQLAAMCAEEELAAGKEQKLQELARKLDEDQRTGVEVGGLRLASGIHDQNRFAALMGLCHGMLRTETATPETMVALADAQGNIVPIAIGALDELLVAYGLACMEQQQQAWQAAAAIRAATTLEDLAAIAL